MTTAYRSIAHKGQRIDRIDIDGDCNVRMLSKSGRDNAGAGLLWWC